METKIMKKKYISPATNDFTIHATSILSGSIIVDGTENNASVEVDEESSYGGVFGSRQFDFDED